MAIEKMLFNGKQYFEGQVPNYIGKTIHTTNIHSKLLFYIVENNDLKPKIQDQATLVDNLEIIEQLVWKNIVYIRIDLRGSYVKADEIFQNGGYQLA